MATTDTPRRWAIRMPSGTEIRPARKHTLAFMLQWVAHRFADCSLIDPRTGEVVRHAA